VNLWTGAAYSWTCVALTTLITVLSRRACARRWGDYRGHLLYFVLFFVLMGLVPALAAGIGSGPARIGLTLGRPGVGLPIVGAALPVVVLVAVVCLRDPALSRQYPLSRAAMASGPGFWTYEIIYAGCYYTAWEFAFRGLLFLPLAAAAGLLPALALQTTLSTLMHLGGPESEVWGALVGGVAFGLLAYFTGSILYPFILHATIGVVHDVLQRRRLSVTV
jgi:membrane protease YdiL (CAAX protease family)